MSESIKVTFLIIEGLTREDLPAVYALQGGAEALVADGVAGVKEVNGRKVERTEVTVVPRSTPAAAPAPEAEKAPEGEPPAKEKKTKGKEDAPPAGKKGKKAKEEDPDAQPEDDEEDDEGDDEDEEEDNAGEDEEGSKEAVAKLSPPKSIREASKIKDVIVWLRSKGVKTVDTIENACASLEKDIPILARPNRRDRIERLLATVED